MKRTLNNSGKFSLILAGILLLTTAASAQVSLREALDFDGDNKADYLLYRPSNSIWYILQSGGGYNYGNFGMNFSTRDYLTPGDYDGDNKADLCVWRESNGVWYLYNSSNNAFYTAQFGISGDEPVARDYDGDGKTDFAVVRRIPPTSSSLGMLVWYILRSSDGGFVAFQFGYDTDYTAPGDYDGDGKFDYAVQRPGATLTTQSTFYVYRSSDSVLQATNFSLKTDSVVPGDYDGDGKTDYAVVRDGVTSPSNSPTNIVWYVMLSGGGYKIVSFGLTGSDHTAQGDYDGDGKTDPAVWRETDKKFYILRSSDNALGVVQLGLYGDYPIAGYDTH